MWSCFYMVYRVIYFSNVFNSYTLTYFPSLFFDFINLTWGWWVCEACVKHGCCLVTDQLWFTLTFYGVKVSSSLYQSRDDILYPTKKQKSWRNFLTSNSWGKYAVRITVTSDSVRFSDSQSILIDESEELDRITHAWISFNYSLEQAQKTF